MRDSISRKPCPRTVLVSVTSPFLTPYLLYHPAGRALKVVTQVVSGAGTEEYIEVPMDNTGDIAPGQWSRKTVNLGMSRGRRRVRISHTPTTCLSCSSSVLCVSFSALVCVYVCLSLYVIVWCSFTSPVVGLEGG